LNPKHQCGRYFYTGTNLFSYTEHRKREKPMIPAIILKKDREISLLRRHPWVFSNAVQEIIGEPASGDTVDICSCHKVFLARGAFSRQSQIIVRVWSFAEDQNIDDLFFFEKIRQAMATRYPLISASALSACRLINAESDGLPGIIVDKYAGFLVCQFSSCGAERWKTTIVSALVQQLSPEGIYERSDIAVREKEGLPMTKGVLWGAEPTALVEIEEKDMRLYADVLAGHKTGLYLDQRDNRTLVTTYAKDREILNCFSYTGGFTIAALKGGAAHVTDVESSGAALVLCRKNLLLNGLDVTRVESDEEDVFSFLRKCRDSRRTFDGIILDPPKFAESKSQIIKAARGYKDINLLALKLIRPGGLLFTFSCSGLINADLFGKIIFEAALDAKRDVQILHRMFQSSDHPTSIYFPEGTYLKGLVCRVL
jgi:23S rRNA (cytosine1962-C5)-methyltransferase